MYDLGKYQLFEHNCFLVFMSHSAVTIVLLKYTSSKDDSSGDDEGSALCCYSARFRGEGDLLGEKNWILHLGKGPPRAPAAREAVARTTRGELPPPRTPPPRRHFWIFVVVSNQ